MTSPNQVRQEGRATFLHQTMQDICLPHVANPSSLRYSGSIDYLSCLTVNALLDHHLEVLLHALYLSNNPHDERLILWLGILQTMAFIEKTG